MSKALDSSRPASAEPRRASWAPETPKERAQATLALVAEYDRRFRNMSAEEVQTQTDIWAGQIYLARVSWESLQKAVHRVYSRRDLPRHPVGEVLGTARDYMHTGPGAAVLEARERYARPPAEPMRIEDYIPEIAAAACSECGAGPGEVCRVEDGSPRIVAHGARRLAARRAR